MHMEENSKPVVGLSDRERFPLILDLSLLNKMKQDEYAPIFNFQSGDRLTQSFLDSVYTYAHQIRGKKLFWDREKQADWIDEYFLDCVKSVPFYKNRKGSFKDQPTISRGDLAKAPWEFVTDAANVEELLVYHTSGSTGAAMNVLFDPVSQACWVPQLQSILDQYNITIDTGPDTVAIALICSQSSTLTYASLSTYLDGAGILKVNLHPAEWKDPAHSVKYLEKFNPQILTGDPFAFLDLLRMQPKIRPKVMVSSAMKLTDGIRQMLESYFNCPVLDIYSMTECRMIAVAEKTRHKAIRPELYLEIFDKDEDRVLPYGQRGELVITGRSNEFLTLVRYRTGDFCSLQIENGIPY
jgi:phenylacetate-CoA ligase